MNVLPNSFIPNSSVNIFTSSSVIPTAIVTTVSPTMASKPPSIAENNRSTLILKCAVCGEVLINNQNKISNYRMMAVRPTIGSSYKDPFFPILESLTNTSAVHVPCCLVCSDTLLKQWNDYEKKDTLVKNRTYNLPAKAQKYLSTLPTNVLLVDNNINHKSPPSIPLQSNNTRIFPICLTNNNGNNLILNNQADCNSNSTTPSPQEEVLDLSMTGVNSAKNDSNVSSVSKEIITIVPTTLNLSNKSPASNSTVLNVATNDGARSRNASRGDNIIAISPYSVNSSMTNLIKVSASPVSLTLKPFETIQLNTIDNANSSNNCSPSSRSSLSGKRLLINCALCDEHSPSLYSIFLYENGNYPYYPALLPLVKANHIDSAGKINVCESCHCQLVSQWDIHQKANKPIIERQYHLVRGAKISPSTQNSVISGPAIVAQNNVSPVNTMTNNVNSTNNRNNAPPISQSFASIVAANRTFICVICRKDLLSIANLNQSNSTHQIAYSVLTELDTVPNSGVLMTKKLIVQSAQEINLRPFLSSATSMYPNQLQLLHENNRVLICSPCFDQINTCFNNDNEKNCLSAEQKSNTRSTPQDSFNGVIASSTKSANSQEDGNQLCLACNLHKYQYLVETKENTMKKPFFPFLHDRNEPNGRARLCAPCHLMLETQWDAYENSYVPYNQRVYRLPSTINSQSTIIAKRPPLSSSSITPVSNIASISPSVNGQSQLKIQIGQPIIATNSGIIPSSDHLLLTTVNQSQANNHQITNSSTTVITPNDYKNDQHFQKLFNEFLMTLGGPNPVLSGTCAVCQLYSVAGQSYHMYASCRKMVLSPILGIYPYFPMLKQYNKKNNKNSQKQILVCTYCYHSLIAQWTRYHVSSNPEDRDPLTRQYNVRQFICFVCGGTAIRKYVRSIAINEFPFLLEHKSPPGSFTIDNGEKVITCVNCYQTLTHQWTEHERMKVPLEMRKYNWMAVQRSSSPSNDIKRHSINTERTIIPIITNTSSLSSYQLNTNSANQNGLIAIPVPTQKAIIINTGGVVNYTSSPSSNAVDTSTKDSSNMGVVAPTFNPSHTLAPLVAAAMAATPVTIKQETSHSTSEPIMTNTSINSTLVNSDMLKQIVHSQPQQLNIHDSQMQLLNQNQDSNLTTLASVAALAGNRNPTQFVNNHLMTRHSNENKFPEHTELPKAAVINSNSFAIHFNATSNDYPNNTKKKIDEQNCIKKNLITIINNNQRTAQIMEWEELFSDNDNYDKCLSKINIEVMKLRNKRKAYLNKLKRNFNANNEYSKINDDMSDGFDDNSLDIQQDSFVNFIDDVLPVLPLNKNDSNKMNFLSELGLITHQKKRERELDEFIQRRKNRRICNSSFRLQQLRDNANDILDFEPGFEKFKRLAFFSQSDIVPNLDIDNAEQNQLVNSTSMEDKDEILNAIGLVPSTNKKKIKMEFDWLSVLKNRLMRRKRGEITVGKTYNNLTNEVLNVWLPKLLSSSSLDPKLIKEFNKILPINFESADEELKKDNIEMNQESRKLVTLECRFSPTKTINSELKRNELINYTNTSTTTNDNQAQSMILGNTISLLNNSNKIINSKQFAQEFHESVLLETQKQISKNNGSSSSSLITINHCGGGGHNDVNLSTINHAQAIIYSDHIRINNETNLHPHNQPSLDRNGLIVKNLLTDKNGVHEQILKLQNRINDINQECKVWNEKKNEITITIEKLENEKSLCLMELDRLSKIS